MPRVEIYPDEPGWSAKAVVLNHEIIGRGMTEGAALGDLFARIYEVFQPVDELRDEIRKLARAIDARPQ